MERFWLKNYPPGVPADIDPSVYPSVASLLEESFAKYRDAKAYVCMGAAITFGEIDVLWTGGLEPVAAGSIAIDDYEGLG